MQHRFFKFIILLYCSVLMSCASGVKSIDGVLEFERTIQENEKGVLCGTLDTSFIGEITTNARYNFWLTLQKLGHYANQDEAKENQITVKLTYPFNNTFSVPLPPGEYLPLNWQCKFFYKTDRGTVIQENNWMDFTSKSQLTGKDSIQIEDPFPQTQILIEPGKFTYIGKIKLRLPLLNTPIEFFAENLKNGIKANSEEAKASLKYGLNYNSELPPGLIASNKTGSFVYTYISDSLGEYKKAFTSVFGASPVFKKMPFDNKDFNIAILRGIGFTYTDLR